MLHCLATQHVACLWRISIDGTKRGTDAHLQTTNQGTTCSRSSEPPWCTDSPCTAWGAGWAISRKQGWRTDVNRPMWGTVQRRTYHCRACGWKRTTPAASDVRIEGLTGFRACPACGSPALECRQTRHTNALWHTLQDVWRHLRRSQ